MDDMVELRCKYCGAPLDRKDIESDSPYVTCPSCGTTQQRLDAKKYMEQMMGQIQSWISKMVPGGFAAGSAQNVDPVARHSIFVNNVKPRLEVEINEYRFALNSLIANPLVVLPFCKGEPVKADHTAAQAFEFDAKLKSVEPLAVDSESREMIESGRSMANTYALIVNNSKLLTDTTPGRFAMMSNNFKESADAMKSCKGYESLASRLTALSEMCVASDMVLNGDALGCSVKAESAVKDLEKAKQDLLANPKLAMCLRAVDLEISQGKTLKDVTDMATRGTTKDPLKMLTLMTGISSINYPSNPQWDRLLKKDERNDELYGYVQKVVSAKNGADTIPICTGGGNVLFPFWDVDLHYSFTSGTMFSKKSVVVEEDLLIPATFTIYGEALSNPRAGITDIFAAAPESSIMTRVKGQEQSISGGAGIGRLTDSAAPGSPGSRTTVLPLSTKAEASRLVEMYLTQCSKTHSKLKLSKPVVARIVYVPCSSPDGHRIALPEEFRGLSPSIMRGADLDKLIKL